jgi:tyrosinase
MDRLWDVWTRKQQALKLPWLPAGDDLKAFSQEPFLFFTDGQGKPVGPTSKAGDYVGTDAFDYDYEPGFGENMVQQAGASVASAKAPALRATIKDNAGAVTVPRAAVQSHLAAGTAQRPLVAQVTLPRPGGLATARDFDVLVNAPPGVASAGPDTPYYAGTIAFFGPMMPGMHMATDTTFAVPLPKAMPVFTQLKNAERATLNIRVAPSRGRRDPAPTLKAVSVGSL